MAKRQRGQILPHGPGEFRIRYRPSNSTGGRDTIFDEIFKGTEAEAEKRRTELLYKYDAGLAAKKDSKLLSEWLAYWNTPTNRQVSKSEFDYSEIVIRRYLNPRLGHMKVQAIRPNHVREALRDLRDNGRDPSKPSLVGKPMSKATVRHAYDKLKLALDLAKTDQLIAINPCDSVDRPALEKKTDKAMPKPDQVTAFLEHCRAHSDKVGLYGLLAIETGFRLGECGGVRGACVSREFKSVRCNAAVKLGEGDVYFLDVQPKTQSGFRTVGVTDVLLDAIDGYVAKQNELRAKLGTRALGEDDPIFLNVDGSLDRMDTVSKQISAACEKAGIDGSMHTMRHAHATYLLTVAKLDIKRVQKRLGHASPQTTMNIYAHLIQEVY